jgi:hypothetical protein
LRRAIRDTNAKKLKGKVIMKAFLWACVACIGISVAAGFVLRAQNDAQHPTRAAESVRLN